ncbi:MAG: N-acetylmuramoyl-L-alanine amidase [Nocardioides sp.]
MTATPDGTPLPTGRRPLLKAFAGGALAMGAIGGAVRIFDGHGSSGLPTLTLSATSSDVQSLDILLGDDLLPRVGTHEWRSPHVPTTTHSMVAFTWHERATAPRILISSRKDGTWRPWQQLTVLHDLPDPDSGEGHGVAGTDLVWIGDSDGIQVRVYGRRPADLTMVLLHPARRAADAIRAGKTDDLGAESRRTTSSQLAPAPTLLTRADWGADESWRNGAPRYNTTIQQTHVHHTASNNDYTTDDVPALIRGMYRYHTHNLGWSDIAYNFLVDKFGRTWVGRAGGPDKLVRGAHTLGFNATSTGVSCIGNFDLIAPTPAVLDAVAAVAAWKLDPFGRNPLGTIAVRSEGSDKYAANRVATLPVVDGHRDTNDTECPGQKLYDSLPSIRQRTQAIIAAAHVSDEPLVRLVGATTVTGTPLLGEVLTVTPGTFAPADATATYAWLRNGVAVPGATATTYQPVAAVVGTQLSVRVEVAKSGYQTLTEQVAVVGLVTAPTVVSVTADPAPKRALLRISVTAPGTTLVPTGQVSVSLGGHTKVLDLVDGAALGRFFRMTPGAYPAEVSYAGSTALLASQGSATVQVD